MRTCTQSGSDRGQAIGEALKARRPRSARPPASACALRLVTGEREPERPDAHHLHRRRVGPLGVHGRLQRHRPSARRQRPFARRGQGGANAALSCPHAHARAHAQRGGEG
eukprot:4609255-Pleurochrysis_carterae.AAC.1